MPRLRPRVILNHADLSTSGMSTQAPLADPAPAAGQPNYLGRLVAYIPGEIIAVYQGFAGPISDGDGETANKGVLIGLGLGLLAVTPLWVYFSTKDKGEPPAYHQILIATLAFAVWLLAVSNPVVDTLPGWQPIYGSLALAFTAGIIFPLIERAFKK